MVIYLLWLETKTTMMQEYGRLWGSQVGSEETKIERMMKDVVEPLSPPSFSCFPWAGRGQSTLSSAR